MAAVDEHGELDPGRPAVVEDLLDGGTHRSPRIQDVVDDHDRAPLDGEVKVGRKDDRGAGPDREVVAVEGDVDVAQRDGGVEQLADQRVQTGREDGAATMDTH